jgi:hypothetical protein
MKSDVRERLIDLLQRANAAAVAADPGESSDGGTCNCDTPAFRIERARETEIEELAQAAGVRVTSFTWFGGRRWFWLNVPLYGQANRRSTMMEAAQRVLRDAEESNLIPGLKTCGYHQMD